MMRSGRWIAGFGAMALGLAVAACGGEAQPPADAAPEAPLGITVADGWLSLPAVAGNPGAVYFSITNGGTEPATIRAVNVAGATSAGLHETATWNRQTDMQELVQVPVAAGEQVMFEPGGKHVMAFELDETLSPGGETEVTLTFTGGDKISFPAEIHAPGEDGSAHSAH